MKKKNPPKQRIGEVSAITISTPDLGKSCKYYYNLGFAEIMRSDFPFPWVQLTDGVLLIMLKYDTAPYSALTYYVDDIYKSIEKFAKAGVYPIEPNTRGGTLTRFLFRSPDGLNISLISPRFFKFRQPDGPNMLTMKKGDYFNPDCYVNKACGLYGEFAHPVKDLSSSIIFWESLGFEVVSQSTTPYAWAILSDGVSIIGLHEASHFVKPTITFFAVDMDEKIAALKQNGLTDFVEMGNEHNIILTTPEDQRINLFRIGKY